MRTWPPLGLKTAMAQLAFAEFKAFSDLTNHMRGEGIDPQQAMAPFVVPFAAFHERTRPSDWLEALVKAYVGEGVARTSTASSPASSTSGPWSR